MKKRKITFFADVASKIFSKSGRLRSSLEGKGGDRFQQSAHKRPDESLKIATKLQSITEAPTGGSER